VHLKQWDAAKDAELKELVAKHSRPFTASSSTFGSPVPTKPVDWKALEREAKFHTTKEACEQRWVQLNRPVTRS